MSHPLYWPTKLFFYPIGNTAAASLTRDLSPEQSADILLLGCGDPRNILYTLYSDVTVDSAVRKMDITCCDLEPAILARNILLFSLLENNEPMDRVWEIFYHFKIDHHALKLLVAHSQELYNHARTIESWRASRFNSFLKMVDSRTLAEIRSYWKRYIEFPKISGHRLQRLLNEQVKLSKSVFEKAPANISAGRSAGMLWPNALVPAADLFRAFWETGTIFTRGSDISYATKLNPTFIYSLSGEVFNPHYASFPAYGFHLAPAFAPVDFDPAGPLPNTGSTILNVCRQQFKAWCESFRRARAAEAITIRFFSGDALAFCHALKSFAETGKPSTSTFVSAWRAPQINLDQITSVPQAPTTFDVIDTSNLADHLGLLNLIIATSPLLKKEPASQAVLYTETLIPIGQDAISSFKERICTDVPTLALLFGIAPRPYVSGFTTESNVHELLVGSMFGGQCHERIAWVNPTGLDPHAGTGKDVVAFEVEDLAHAIFGIYNKMFAHENPTFFSLFFTRPSKAPAKLMSIERMHYQHETVALLFRAIQDRVRVRDGHWYQVAGRLLELVKNHSSRLAGSNYEDLCLQLHIHGIYTVPSLDPELHNAFRATTRTSTFDVLPNPPLAVCVVLIVPRKSLQPLFNDPEQTGNPNLQCSLRAGDSHYTYSAIHTVWGKCVTVPHRGITAIQEDPHGMRGQSDLIVSFWAHTRFLELPDTKIALGIKATPRSKTAFTMSLGRQLEIFSSPVTDETHVQLLTYRPVLSSEIPQTLQNIVPNQPSGIESTDNLCQAIVDKKSGGDGNNVHLLSSQIDLGSTFRKSHFPSEENSSTTQVAPCTIQVTVGDHKHRTSYSYPVRGEGVEIHVSKEVNQIKIIAPVSSPLDNVGHFSDPFPITRRNAYTPWNLHHIGLDRLPLLKKPEALKLLDAHSAFQLSSREVDMITRENNHMDNPKDTLAHIKSSVHTILMHSSGIEKPCTSAFALCEPTEGRVYAVLLVGGIRLDLGASTVAVDTALVPLFEKKCLSSCPLLRNFQINLSLKLSQLMSERTLGREYSRLLSKDAVPGSINQTASITPNTASPYPLSSVAAQYVHAGKESASHLQCGRSLNGKGYFRSLLVPLFPPFSLCRT